MPMPKSPCPTDSVLDIRTPGIQATGKKAHPPIKIIPRLNTALSFVFEANFTIIPTSLCFARISSAWPSLQIDSSTYPPVTWDIR